jgi:hypothetical protein
MEKFEQEVKEFRNLQQGLFVTALYLITTEFTKVSSSRAKFLTQLNENELVKKVGVYRSTL